MKLNPVIQCIGCKKSLKLSIYEQEKGLYECPNCRKSFSETYIPPVEPDTKSNSGLYKNLIILLVCLLPLGLVTTCIFSQLNKPAQTQTDRAFDHGRINGMSAGSKGGAAASDEGLSMVARTHYPDDYASQTAFVQGFKKGYQESRKE